MYVHVDVGAVSQPPVFPERHPPCFLRQVLSLRPGAHHLSQAGWPTSPQSSASEEPGSQTHDIFLLRCWALNSGPLA